MIPTGLELLDAIAATAIALFICWLGCLYFEFLIRLGQMSWFLHRRLIEEGGGGFAQRLRIASVSALPFIGDNYLRARLRRYANHPGYRDEWRP